MATDPKQFLRTYPVNYNADIDPARIQGRFVDIYDTRTRFVVGRFTADEDIEVGIFCYLKNYDKLWGQNFIRSSPLGFTSARKGNPGTPPPPPAGSPPVDDTAALASPIFVGVSVVNPVKGLKDMFYDETLGNWFYRKGSTVTIATDGDVYMFAEGLCRHGEQIYTRNKHEGNKTRIGAVVSQPNTIPPSGLSLIASAKFLENIPEQGGIVAVKLSGL